MSQKGRDIRRVFGCGRNEESGPQALNPRTLCPNKLRGKYRKILRHPAAIGRCLGVDHKAHRPCWTVAYAKNGVINPMQIVPRTGSAPAARPSGRTSLRPARRATSVRTIGD